MTRSLTTNVIYFVFLYIDLKITPSLRLFFRFVSVFHDYYL